MSRTTKTYDEQMAELDERIQQAKNRKKQITQRHNAAERKARTHRLCRRHGLLEMFMPDLAVISDEQFELFIKRGIDTSYGRGLLAEIVGKPEAHITPGDVTAQG